MGIGSAKICWLGAMVALIAWDAGCKYDPNPPEGAQACYQLKCPDGYVCGDDSRCYTPSNLPVASASGGVPGGTGGRIAPGTGGIGSGGVKGGGGAIGNGGTTVQGGTTSTGGTTTPPNSGTAVTIVDGQAQGAMTGYGWVALGTLDTIDEPICNSPAGPITADASCADTQWSVPNAYCVSGYIPQVASEPEFERNWGILIGIDATPDTGGVLGQTFSSLIVSTSGSPSSGLRVQVHRKDDPDTTNYCASMTPGVATSFSSFNTTCWNNEGSFLSAADVPNLDQIAMQVPSTMDASITVKGLCITGITFAK